MMMMMLMMMVMVMVVVMMRMMMAMVMMKMLMMMMMMVMILMAPVILMTMVMMTMMIMMVKVAQPLQCQLPLRLGEGGLRSQEQLAPAAWVASWAQCVAAVLGRTGLECLANLETCTLPLADACREARAQLPPAPAAPAGGARAEPPLGTWRELALEPRKKVQRLFSSWLDKKDHANCLTLLSPEDRAQLRSCAGPLAAGRQWATGATPAERLDDASYRFTARSLLCQAVAPASGATCHHRARTGDNAGRL